MLESDLEMARQPVQIVRQELHVEVPRRRVGRPYSTILLVGPHQDTSTLLAHVDLAGVVGSRKQFATERDDLGNVFRDDVHVLHGEHRQLDAGHAPDFARPEAGGVDDVLADDLAFVGDDEPAAVGPGLQRDHAREAMDVRAGLARRDGVGLRDTVRVDVPAVRAVQRADELAYRRSAD